MSKTILLVAFIGMCLLQLFLPACTIFQMENVVEEGTTYRFRCAPVDPNDPFRGKYLTLNFQDTVALGDLDATGATSLWNRPLFYILIDPTSEKEVRLLRAQSKRPAKDIPYVKGRLLRFLEEGQDGVITEALVTYEFNRFYIEEDEAKLAETLYNKASRNEQMTTYAVVKVKDGNAVLQDVEIDGTSIYELVKEQQK